jgi:euchromatic histone-lysine N-methyltransferase
MGNKAGGSELKRMENGIAGSRRKRLLKYTVNPPPKKLAVSPIHEHPPPGCGSTAITTKVWSFGGFICMHICSFPWEGATITTTDNGVLEVALIGTFAPGCGMSAVNTTGSRDEGSLIETTTVNNGKYLGCKSGFRRC